jgi:hypothetical protein
MQNLFFRLISKLNISSFFLNSPEAISYNKLVYYTIITSFISITRIDIKKKVKNYEKLRKIMKN